MGRRQNVNGLHRGIPGRKVYLLHQCQPGLCFYQKSLKLQLAFPLEEIPFTQVCSAVQSFLLKNFTVTIKQ